MKKNNFKQIIILLCMSLFIACGDDNNEEGDNNLNSINKDEYLWFFSGEIDGEPFIYGQKTDISNQVYSETVNNSLPSTCVISEDNGYQFGTGIYPSFDESLPTMDIEFLRMHLCSSSLSVRDVFNDLFSLKEYELTDRNDNREGNEGKVGMSYSPNINEDLYYTTYNENASDGYFEITKSTENNIYLFDEIYTSVQTIEGNFAVKLYNTEDVSDVVEITNGAFKVNMSY